MGGCAHLLLQRGIVVSEHAGAWKRKTRWISLISSMEEKWKCGENKGFGNKEQKK